MTFPTQTSNAKATNKWQVVAGLLALLLFLTNPGAVVTVLKVGRHNVGVVICGLAPNVCDGSAPHLELPQLEESAG
jgi:hypothetical protein